MYYYYYPYEMYGRLPEFSGFKERLEYLLAGRKLHPWVTGLGASRGAAEKMQKGQIPGSEILKAIHFQECVDLTWLVTGEGGAFRIYNAPDAIDFEDHIVEMLAFQKVRTQDVYICDDGKRMVLAATRKKSYKYKYRYKDLDRDNQVEYQAWEMATGPFSKSLFEILVKHFTMRRTEGRGGEWFHVQMTPVELTSMIKGEQSPLVLFGDQKKLEGKTEPVPITSIRSTLKPLLTDILQSTDTLEASSLMQIAQVIKAVDVLCDRRAVDLSPEQKGKIYASVYNNCMRTGDSPDNVVSGILPSLLDMI